ncbi:KLH10 protein, partial [Polypterus senegalus]|nr:KLH10 protein [Polypterus senegalus]
MIYSIPGISPDMMEMIVTFAYTQTVSLTEENVTQLLSVSDQFNILGLVKLCCDFLESHLSLENCLGTCKLAYRHSCSETHFKAFRFTMNEFKNLVTVSEEFLQLSFFELYDIIEQDELNVQNESQVFNAIMKWIFHQPNERKKFLPKLLSKVRLTLKESRAFLDNAKKSDYVKNTVEYKLFVYRALMQLINELSITEASTPEPSYSISHTRLPYSILLSIGGWNGSHPANIIEAYDARAKIWTDVTCEKENPRAYFGTVYIKGYVYLIGGFDGINYLNMVHRLNPVTRVRQEVAPMHSCRCYFSVVALNGFIYALGGFDGHSLLNTAEKYNTELNQWSSTSSMNERRNDASATALNGKIYICGGSKDQVFLATAEVYDPQKDQWSMIAPMPTKRSSLGVVAYNNEVYAVGGFYRRNCLNTVEAYNPLTNTWRPIPSMISPRCNFGIALMEGLIFAVGGFNGFSTTAQAEYYNKDTNEWKEGQDMNLDRGGLSCCVLSGLPNIREYAARRKPPQLYSLSQKHRTSAFRNVPAL